MHTWTTLQELRNKGACEDRYEHLVALLPEGHRDDEPIDLCTILSLNGLGDVLWIPRNIVHGDHVDMRYRLFAVACAQDVLRLMQDQRSRDGVRIAHLHAYGEATDEELSAAWAAALEAAWAAAWVSEATWEAAQVAVRASAWAAAWEAAQVAIRTSVSARKVARKVARVARKVARNAAGTATWAAECAKQTEWLHLIFSADM